MADIVNLKRQHQDFLDLINKITIYKLQPEIVNHASEISLLLSQLSGKLKIHVSTEDKFLYPALTNHPNAKVQAISQAFHNEMGDLAMVFEDFKSKFMTANKISNNPAAFLQESQNVFAALTKRITKENTELYPLLSVS